MPMLDANDPTFFQLYPNGCTVYDRLGRRLTGVVACDPQTGEVVSAVGLDGSASNESPHEILPVMEGQVMRRRRHHPAPLTIEPRQWLHIGMD
jgi:hypothetical protein